MKKLFIELFAFICRICPLCIIARKFPDSKFAARMNSWGKSCPFCLAYKKIHIKT
ncbi:MAG: hypothetical protein KAV18_03055 [Candidatus Omnitrophica bacterium]|nr:hypothetical protein [Candidatus Omnitrophota bacterium]